MLLVKRPRKPLLRKMWMWLIQGEGDKPNYKEYLMDIPHEWDIEEADVPEWDNDFDNDTQTEYQVNMILIGNEYHGRKCMFMAKYTNNAPSALKQE
jgi:hypothetical protein